MYVRTEEVVTKVVCLNSVSRRHRARPLMGFKMGFSKNQNAGQILTVATVTNAAMFCRLPIQIRWVVLGTWRPCAAC